MENYIDKRYTNIIKGVALIFMFIHHFFTFPERLVDGIVYSNIDWFANAFHDPLKTCVSIFAFLTGYFYYFNKKKTLRYSIRKATDIYINYLIVLGLMLIMDFFLKCYEFSPKSIVLELLLVDQPNMEFCWYVAFFIIIIFLLPLYSRVSEKSSILAVICGIVFPYVIVLILDTIKGNSNVGSIEYIFDMIKYLTWFPCVASGFFFAQEGLFQKLDIWYSKHKAIQIIVYLLFMILPFFARKANSSFDFIFAPSFIFGLVGILRMIKHIKVLLPLSIIGKYSLLMWFLHSVFFNVSKEYTQPILYYPRNPILVVLWGLIMCLAVAFVISFPINWINKMKNKLFKLA